MDPLLEAAVESLEREPALWVPVARVWEAIKESPPARGRSRADLERILRAEKDTFLYARPCRLAARAVGCDPGEIEAFERELYALGAPAGTRVMLKSRRPTRAEIFAEMANDLQRLGDALEAAWRRRPRPRPEMERQLRGLVREGLILEEKLERTFRGRSPPHS